MKLSIKYGIFIWVMSCQSLVADEADKINVIGFAPHPAIQQHYLTIVQQSYLNIGLTPDFIPLSDKRSIKMLRENKIDGVVVRTENIIKLQANYIPVPPALGTVEIRLICQPTIPCDKNIFDDANKILGLVAQQEYYLELLKDKTINVYEVGNYQRVEQMFKQQKLDAMIMVFDLNTQDVASLQLNTYLLARHQGYHMIHKRFSAYIAKLSESLTGVLATHTFTQSNLNPAM